MHYLLYFNFMTNKIYNFCLTFIQIFEDYSPLLWRKIFIGFPKNLNFLFLNKHLKILKVNLRWKIIFISLPNLLVEYYNVGVWKQITMLFNLKLNFLLFIHNWCKILYCNVLDSFNLYKWYLIYLKYSNFSYKRYKSVYLSS
jgi:hypothetical protein